MSNVGADSQSDCAVVQTFRLGRSPNATAMFFARVYGDLIAFILGAAWVNFPDASTEPAQISAFHGIAPERRPLTGPGPCLIVGQTFHFGLLYGSWFNQHTLPLVPFSAFTEFHHQGPNRGMLFGAPSKRSVSTGQKLQFPQTRTVETDMNISNINQHLIPNFNFITALSAKRLPCADINCFTVGTRLWVGYRWRLIVRLHGACRQISLESAREILPGS